MSYTSVCVCVCVCVLQLTLTIDTKAVPEGAQLREGYAKLQPCNIAIDQYGVHAERHKAEVKTS